MRFVTYAKWADLPSSAERLFEKGAAQSMFFSRPWFENLTTTTLPSEDELCLATVLRDRTVLALLPLTINGESAQSFTHIYSSLFSLLWVEQSNRDALVCLAKGLANLPVRSLKLEPVAIEDHDVRALTEALEQVGFECHHYTRFYNWFHRPDRPDFERYLSERPSKLRNTLARKQRKLAREYDYRIRLFVDNDIDKALADYDRVYRASWKASEVFPKMVEGLVRRFAEQGWLRLAILYVDQVPIAAQIWFVAYAKASIFKLAYDARWKRFSPGSILTCHLMRHVTDIDQVTEIDFLYGNDAYKSDWMSQRRERSGLVCGLRKRPKQSWLARLTTRFG